MKFRFIFLFLFLILTTICIAQTRYVLQGGGYSFSIPLDNTAEFVKAESFLGAYYEGFYGFTPHLSIGWLVGWNVFYKKLEKVTYTYENVTLTGNQYKSLNVFPIYFRGLYMFGVDEGIRTFVGSGFGVLSDNRQINMGLSSFKNNYWHLSICPELGIIIPFNLYAMNISFRYNYGLKTSNNEDLSFISINLGFLMLQ